MNDNTRPANCTCDCADGTAPNTYCPFHQKQLKPEPTFTTDAVAILKRRYLTTPEKREEYEQEKLMSTPSQPAPELPCAFCGKPKDDELHRADEKLLACSSWAKDDYHDFAESPYREFNLEREVISLGKSCAVWITGDPDDTQEVTCTEGALQVIRECIRLRQERNNELNNLREPARQRERLVWLALEESVKLQSHYAMLLNMHDGGKRRQFVSATEWMERLQELSETESSEKGLRAKAEGAAPAHDSAVHPDNCPICNPSKSKEDVNAPRS